MGCCDLAFPTEVQLRIKKWVGGGESGKTNWRLHWDQGEMGKTKSRLQIQKQDTSYLKWTKDQRGVGLTVTETVQTLY